MADDLSSKEWRTFLEARIQQENGNDAEALDVFESLYRRHPGNPHLKASRAYALQRLGRASEADLIRIDAEYSEAGRTLIGERDEPEAWISRLSSLVESLDKGVSKSLVSSSMVDW